MSAEPRGLTLAAAGSAETISTPFDAMESTLARLLPWLVAAIVLVVGVALIDGLPVGVMHDDGMYVILAKALATGHGYRWINVPGDPPATHFPPGYPALLALVWHVFPVFPANVIAFKLLNVLLAMVTAVATMRLCRERFALSPAASAVVAVTAMLSIPMLILSTLVMSETLFLAMVIPVLVLAERAVDRDQDWRLVVVAGLLAGAATLVRSQGIALVAAIPVALLAQRRVRHAAGALVASLLVLTPWQLFAATHEGYVAAPLRGNYESYSHWLVAAYRAEGPMLLVRTVGQTSRDLAAMFATLGAPSMPPVWRLTALVSVVVLIAFGAPALWRRARVTALFLGLYSLIVLAWPFAPSRFIWGIWPLVMLVVVLGGRQIVAWSPASRPYGALRAVLLAGTLALALGFGSYTWRGYRDRYWSSIPRSQAANLRPMVQWIAARTAPTDVLAVDSEGAAYLYTGRRAVPATSFTVDQYFRRRTVQENADDMMQIVRFYHVTAVALSASSLVEAAHALAMRTPPALMPRDRFENGIALTPAQP